MRGKDRNRRKARRLRAEHIKLGGRDRGSEGTTESAAGANPCKGLLCIILSVGIGGQGSFSVTLQMRRVENNLP